MDDYNIPDDLLGLFKGDPQTYHIYDSDTDMDNIAAMILFLDCVGVNSDYVEVDDGTQVILSHEDFPYHICIDSYGHGDFSRHAFDVSRIKNDGSGADFIPPLDIEE